MDHQPETDTPSHLVVVANRLPVTKDEETGEWRSSPGGLVSALAPVLRERSGTWVGWAGGHDEPPDPFTVDDIDQVPVRIDAEEFEGYYEGFCNGTIWPLYHDAIRPVEMHRHWWKPYREVNQRFADRTAEVAGPGDAIWVQDYQLQLVPGMLRKQLPDARIGFFLHIPFPPLEIFARLPWREEVLAGLLGADILGFHTRTGAVNFARAAREYGGASGPMEALSVDGRTVHVMAVPISIDVTDFETVAALPEVVDLAARVRVELGSPESIVLGVDRLDYTKGIDLRLRAFETLLSNRPDLHGRVVFVQIAVPSRQGVGEYQIIRRRVEELVGRINGRFGQAGWVPVHYQHRSLERDELIAHYRAADVLVVTPLRDGMNLVAKEYVSTRLDRTGTLVLSEFAGAAEQLTDAFIVNPYDLDELAETLERAIELDLSDQRRRMKTMRRVVKRFDVHRWARYCLEAIDG